MSFAMSNGKPANSDYWWLTSGQDLSNMMREAGYPDEVQRQFLAYYKEIVCPLLGGQPSPSSAKSGLGWDGSPFEYSFELKSSSASSQAVCFGVDLGNLNPPDKATAQLGPLDMACTGKVVDSLATRTEGFDDTWYRSLVAFFGQSQLDPSKQRELVAQVGHQTPVVVGFDLHKRAPKNPENLSLMAKCYFPPCHYAASHGINRWDAIYQAVHQLPDVAPNVLRSLDIIGDYLASKPASWKEGARYLATDFVAPSKNRLKVYLRYPGESFDEIWDYYTLGGRIPTPGGDDEADKAMFRDLIELTGAGGSGERGPTNGDLGFTNFRRKMTCIYFSLSADNATPAPKIGIYPANFAANDGVISRGLDAWLRKYNWPLPTKTIEQQMKHVFPHRSPDDKTGLFAFVSLGRKEDPTKKDMSMQIYMTPELYSNPRF